MPSDLFTPPRQRSQSLSVLSSSSPASELPYHNTPSNSWISSKATSPFPTPSPKHFKKSKSQSIYYRLLSTYRFPNTSRWFVISMCLTLAVYLWQQPLHNSPVDQLPREWREDPAIANILRPTNLEGQRSKHDPGEWLRENSNYAFSADQPRTWTSRFRRSSKPRAAIISLVRNEELTGITQSILQLEHRFNQHYHYPYHFFNNAPFTPDFIVATSNLTSSSTHYHTISPSHWSTPPSLDIPRYHNSLEYLGTIGVGKASMLSYRHMCRWNSGFFYAHPALADYDYYWRVEPDVHFLCDIPYDPFRFMRDNNIKYGFNMAILDDARSFPSLWKQTLNFTTLHPELIHPDADVSWLIDPSTAEYNNCQFFSNFELGDLNFFRGKQNTMYFDHLDASGGFFYERFGDAPIHTLSVSLFLPKSQIWFFRDIGYQHDIARHCPASSSSSSSPDSALCSCQPTPLDENFYKLVPMESPQRKPADTCVRLWFGGKWLEKREGWEAEAERAFGGDGFGGYVWEE